MRHFVALAALAALFSIGSNTAHAALVAGFKAGDTTIVGTAPGVIVSTTEVLTDNVLADASSGLITTVEAGASIATFNGSFGSFQPLDLVLFEFAAIVDPVGSFNWTATVNSAGGGSVSKSGMSTGLASGAISVIPVDILSLGGVNFADIQVTLNGAQFANVGTGLANSGYPGFAAVTAVPEPSMIAGLAVLSGAGFLVHRRRRQTAAKA